jgi:hypothetical protein
MFNNIQYSMFNIQFSGTAGLTQRRRDAKGGEGKFTTFNIEHSTFKWAIFFTGFPGLERGKQL